MLNGLNGLSVVKVQVTVIVAGRIGLQRGDNAKSLTPRWRRAMHHTLFDTPVANTLLRGFSVAFLKIAGWKVEGSLPPDGVKCVLIAAPHTSNWDLPFTLMVAASVEAIKAADGPLQLIVPPEGTRSGTRFWKTGFYYIALGAQVPIVMAYMDYEKKVSGLGPVFLPTGDVDADMATIKAFYAPFKGRHPDRFEAE